MLYMQTRIFGLGGPFLMSSCPLCKSQPPLGISGLKGYCIFVALIEYARTRLKRSGRNQAIDKAARPPLLKPSTARALGSEVSVILQAFATKGKTSASTKS